MDRRQRRGVTTRKRKRREIERAICDACEQPHDGQGWSLCRRCAEPGSWSSSAMLRVSLTPTVIPICAVCGKVRDTSGLWGRVHAEDPRPGDLSHGLCPRCAREHYPDHFRR